MAHARTTGGGGGGGTVNTRDVQTSLLKLMEDGEVSLPPGSSSSSAPSPSSSDNTGASPPHSQIKKKPGPLDKGRGAASLRQQGPPNSSSSSSQQTPVIMVMLNVMFLNPFSLTGAPVCSRSLTLTNPHPNTPLSPSCTAEAE